MDSINTAMQKAFWDTDIPDFPPIAFEQGYEMGANYVLEQFENLLPHTAKKGVIYGIIKETIEKLKEK